MIKRLPPSIVSFLCAGLLLVSLGTGVAQAQTKEGLEKIVKEAGGGMLVFQAGEQRLVFASPNLDGVTEIDLSRPDLIDFLDGQKQLDQPQIREELLPIARELVVIGVRQRQEGNWPEALFLYRFGLHITLRFKEWQGVKAIATSLWVLREEMKDFVHGETFPLLMPAQHRQVNSKEHRERREYLTKLLALFHADAQRFSPVAEDLIAQSPPSTAREHLVMLKCSRLLADLAANVALRRAALWKLKAVADSLDDRTAVAVALTQELAQASLLDILSHEGRYKATEEEAGFNEVWHLYFDHRKEVAEAGGNQEVFGNLINVYRAFTYLRSTAVRSGGAFGHRMSYVVSQFLQPVGRDLVYLFMKQGRAEVALAMAEHTRARALADWIARTHASNRLIFNPDIPGWISEVMPATLAEIKQAAATVKASILTYVADHSGYSVWVQTPDGKLVSARIENPQALIGRVFDSLPYFSGGDKLGRSGRRRGASPVGVNEQHVLNEDLKSLYAALFPADIRRALERYGEGGRLVIIADGLLNYVPFCALKTGDGKYLVEKYELIYWPSVTAWMITEPAPSRAAKRAHAGSRRTPRPRQVEAVVLADPLFSKAEQVYFRGKAREVRLDPLPGTAEEAKVIARLFRTGVYTGRRATLDAFRTTLSGFREPLRNISILHLATHGFLNEENPESSFVAFADGILTARELYVREGPFLPEFVMLSACQTGLGTAHPDSPIGLTNAFLIAGANTVGSTLWQIPDDASARLMTRFYSELARGETLPASLRKAQLELLKNASWKDPYYWASYKLLGRLENPLRPIK
jgi:hypothetical protein